MKPSQVPNRLSHPPTRRMLPLQSPELCHRDRLGPPQPPLHPVELIHSSGFAPRSPVNFGSRMNRPLLTPRGRLGPSGPISSSRFIPVSPTNIGASYNRSQPSHPRLFHHASPQSRKGLSNQPIPSHIRRDQVTESMVTLSNSGRKNATVQQQASTEVLFSSCCLAISEP